MRFLLMLLLSACISCNASSPKDGVQESGANGNIESAATRERDWYKQYAGTVAGQPVQVQLHKYGDEFHGAYYYTAKGQILNLLPDPTTGDSVVLSENSTTEEGSWQNGGVWHTIIKGDSLTGDWIDPQGKTVHPIRLKEMYAAGSMKLELVWLKDSAKLNERQKEYTAFASYQFLLPVSNTDHPHKAFVDSVVYDAVSCRSGTIERCMRNMADSFFYRYRDDLGDMDSGAHVSRYEEQLNTWVLFNGDGWLVLECFGHNYMGGAHGIWGSAFLNIDLQRGKLWKLNDVIEGDTAKLRPLLTEAARKYFKLKAGEKLADVLLNLEEPTVAGNFYITPKGLTFVYNPYEITPYAAGMVTLFIPYNKLYGMLTPEFSARMNKK